MTRNLTGNKRLIYDNCVDLYNVVQKWRSLLSDSCRIILNIWEEKESSHKELETEGHSNIDYTPEAFIKLESLSSALYNIIESMNFLVQKVQRIVSRINAISECSDLQQSNSISFMDQIPFKTWHFSKFSAVAAEIGTMLKQEFEVKSLICRELCHISEKSIYLFFETCWKYEPAIDKSRLNMLLNGIIWELGLFSEIK